MPDAETDYTVRTEAGTSAIGEQFKIMKNKIIRAIVIYILMMGFTYGYSYQDEFKYEMKKFPEWEASNASMAETEAGFCAFGWPIYWPCHISKMLWAKVKWNLNFQTSLTTFVLQHGAAILNYKASGTTQSKF